MDESTKFSGYIKFYGPFADDGSVDIAKAGKTLVALDKFLKKYQKEILKMKKEDQFVLKISAVNKNCSEMVIALAQTIQSVPVSFAMIAFGLDKMGISEFGKQFFGTLGKQLALKTFSLGNPIKEQSREIDKAQNIPIVVLQNSNGDSKKFLLDDWEQSRLLSPYLAEIVQLEKGKEEKMKIGYRVNDQQKDVAEIKYEESDYFDHEEGFSIDERMREPFDDSNAKEERIVGRFVDFYGLAHKYHFAFQARKKQDEIGKQKILCIVEDNQISEILDYLKPENSKNVCIFGKATRDWEGKIDKIKIEWVNEDENYDPKQTAIA